MSVQTDTLTEFLLEKSDCSQLLRETELSLSDRQLIDVAAGTTLLEFPLFISSVLTTQMQNVYTGTNCYYDDVDTAFFRHVTGCLYQMN